MQKKLIALAVAGAVAAPAFADSNVTLYGLFDIGFKSNTLKNYNPATGAATTKTTTRNFFGNEGLKNGNRLGVKGSEDLGNGVSAIFLYEMAMGPSSTNHSMKNRQSYVGLKGGFGKVTFGRQYTLQSKVISDYDQSGDYGLNKTAVELVGSRHYVNNGDDRLNNAVLYTTPNFGGFDFGVMGAQSTTDTKNAAGALTTLLTSADHQVGVNYAVADLTTSLVYVTNKQTDLLTKKKHRGLSFGLAYDFTVAKLGAGYNSYKSDSAPFVGGAKTVDDRSSDWMVSASAPVGPLTLGAQYSSGKTKNHIPVAVAGGLGGGTSGKATGYALTAGYDLSKRTGLVFGYAHGKTKNPNITTAKESSYGMSLQHRF